MVQVATPEPLSVWDPQPVMPPPEKATVPVGLEPPVTVAVKVTLWPTVEGFGEDPRAVVVVRALTVWLTVLLLPVLLGSLL